MWTNRKTRGITVLFVLATLGAGCGGTPIVAETTNQVEQTVETTSTDINNGKGSTASGTSLNQADSNIGADTSTTIGSSTPSIPTTVISITTTSTVLDSTTTTNTTSTTATTTATSRRCSPAWIESRAMEPVFISGEIEDIKRANEYYSNNPNDTSTPMGAICWAYHELSSGYYISSSRYMVDYFAIPFFMHEVGITSEQFGPPGPEATGALLDMLSNNNGAAGNVDDGADDQTETPFGGEGDVGPVGSTGDTSSATDVALETFRIIHEYAGDGTAWAEAVGAVASPEMVTAFQANGGLPAEVQVYADALTTFAKEHVGKDFDYTAESDNPNFALPGFPGLKAFVEAAKYHQDCKRALIEDQ